jgi:general secretion pathway protein G
MLHFKREAVINIVFVIVAVLIPLLIFWAYVKVLDPKKDIRATKGNLLVIKEALLIFKHDVGRFPTQDEGLRLLIENKTNIGNWKGPYISPNLLVDLWRNKFIYGNIDETIYIGSRGSNGVLETDLAHIREKKTEGDDILIFIEHHYSLDVYVCHGICGISHLHLRRSEPIDTSRIRRWNSHPVHL